MGAIVAAIAEALHSSSFHAVAVAAALHSSSSHAVAAAERDSTLLIAMVMYHAVLFVILATTGPGIVNMHGKIMLAQRKKVVKRLILWIAQILAR